MGVIPKEQKPPDLEAIRTRSKQFCGMDSIDFVRIIQADIAALLAEVERLGAELAHEQRVTLAYRSDGDVLRAEVERLRGVVSEQQDRNLQLSYAAYPPNPSGE